MNAIEAVKTDLRYLSPEPDRHGNERLYVRKNGRRIRIRAARGTPEFFRAYAAAVEALERPAPITANGGRWPDRSLGWLAEKYFNSEEFTRGLDEQSQATRRRVIEGCLKEPHTETDPDPMGNCPLAYFTPLKGKRLRDLKEGLPGAANNRKKYLSAMFGWGIEAEHCKTNPMRDVRRKKYDSDGFYTWTLNDLTTFENRHPIGSKARLAMALYLLLGVRKGDLVRLGPKMVQTKVIAPTPEHPNGQVIRTIKYVPNKTRKRRRKEVEKPILPQLWAIIEQSQIGTETFLETSFGKPFTAKGFGNWMRDRCDEAELQMCTGHGLRKIGATICAELGATEHQLMAIFDWSTPAQAAVYTRAASIKRLAAGAMHLLAAGTAPENRGGLH